MRRADTIVYVKQKQNNIILRLYVLGVGNNFREL